MRPRASLVPRLVPALEILGATLITVAVAWWAVVYGQVIANTGMAPYRTVACLLRTSDLCSLVMSLCTEWHILGIRRYSAVLLWIGALVSLVALIAGPKYPRRPGA